MVSSVLLSFALSAWCEMRTGWAQKHLGSTDSVELLKAFIGAKGGFLTDFK